MQHRFRGWVMVVMLSFSFVALSPTAAQSEVEQLEALMQEAIDLYFEGDFETAIDLMNEAYALAETDLDKSYIIGWRGWVYMIQGDYAAALEDLNTAVNSSPDYPIVYVDRAMANALNGNASQALNDFKRAIDLQPDYTFTATRELSDYSSVEYFIRNYSIAIDTNPSDYVALTFRGSWYANIGRWEEAVADYERALELQPDFTPASDALAEVQQVLENPDGRPRYCPFPEMSVIPQLELNDSIEGSIDEVYFYNAFCIDAPANTEIEFTVEQTSGDLLPVLALSRNNELIFITDDTEERDSVKMTWTLEEAGYYVIIVTRIGRANGDTEGSFRLTLES